MVITSFISAVLQILVFTLIPFLVYLLTRKKITGFLEYIGLKKSNRKANLLGFLLMLVIALPFIILALTNQEFLSILQDPNSVSGKIKQLGGGFEVVLVILFTAIFKTALAEEIFFRGFLAKRLIAATNFRIGNTIQAVIFGVIHTLLFMSITDNLLFLVVIFIFPSIAAYLKTYLNEKMADGSIIPGWIAHATANILSYSLIAFFV